MSPTERTDRQYWLWVTGEEYYQEKDGSDRKALDPDSDAWMDGGWTCHKDTRRGDLVLLWRTAPKSDIGYLIQADSDAYFDDENERGWDYWCEYRPVYKLTNPLTISDLRSASTLSSWSALRRNFQGRVHEVPAGIWNELVRLASEKDRTLDAVLIQLEKPTLPLTEKELEDYILSNLEALEPFGYSLELYRPTGLEDEGRQFLCKGNGGKIDLLCCDRKSGGYVIVELKMKLARADTFGQICNYIGWVQDNLASGKAVEGLVISRGADVKFKSCLRTTDRVKQVSLKELFRKAPEKRSRKGSGLWHKLKAIID